MLSIKSLSDLISKVSVFLGKASGVVYVAAILLSVTEVFLRYVLNMPTAWNMEIVMALCGTAWLLSVGVVTQQRRHITVTVMEMVVGKKMWDRMTRLAIGLSLLAVAGLLWSVWGPAMKSLAHLERSGSAFNPPVPSYLKVMLAVACVLYGLQLIANLFSTRGASHDHGASDDVDAAVKPKE